MDSVHLTSFANPLVPGDTYKPLTEPTVTLFNWNKLQCNLIEKIYFCFQNIQLEISHASCLGRDVLWSVIICCKMGAVFQGMFMFPNLHQWGLTLYSLMIAFKVHSTTLEHHSYVIMIAVASHMTNVSIVSTTVCSGADQRKHQSSAPLAFVRGIHQWPVVSLTKGQQRGNYSHLMTSLWICIWLVLCGVLLWSAQQRGWYPFIQCNDCPNVSEAILKNKGK